MAKELTFYTCAHCGNVAWKLHDGGAALHCCGEPMKALVPNTVDAAHEKHVPVVTAGHGTLTVSVGAVPHPMEEKHYIGWIAACMGEQVALKFLAPGEAPALTCSGDRYDAVYAWCNLHGLWMA